MLTHHFKPLDRCRPLDNLGLPCISFNVATLSIKNKQKAVQGAEVKLSFYRLRRRAQSETSSRSRFQSSHDQQKWLRTERSGESAFHSLSGTGYFLRLPAPKSGSSSVTRMWAWRHRRWEGQTRHPIWETHQCGARGCLRGGGSRNSGVACT
jgi:hypothetical protein